MSSKLDSLLGMTPRDLVYMWLGITRWNFVYNIPLDIVHLYCAYIWNLMWKLGILCLRFRWDLPRMFDDSFGEYMDIYSCWNSICRVGIWREIFNVFDELLVEVFHRGVLIYGRGFYFAFTWDGLWFGFSRDEHVSLHPCMPRLFYRRLHVHLYDCCIVLFIPC